MALALAGLFPVPAGAETIPRPVGGVANAGYLLAGSDGGVYAFGAAFRGSAGNLRLQAPIVDLAGTPSGEGYWMTASDGGIFAFGDAGFFGSTASLDLNHPIVGMASTPSGRGYWLVAADGGIFTFGDARFLGSTGDIRLNHRIVGMAPTPTGLGYWLVASDGGIFTFGDAVFLGSTGSQRLNSPIVGMAATRSGNGYWLVASDGGIFTFGDAVFLGSTGSQRLNSPIVGMASTPSGAGYWLVAADGGIFAFGDAGFRGSTGDIRLNGRVVDMLPQGGDVTSPRLEHFSFSPSTIDTSEAPRTITVRARITDDLAGHATKGGGDSSVDFRSPSGQSASASFSWNTRISGDALDGVYKAEITVPAMAERGTWTVATFRLVDAVGNYALIEGRTLAQAGYATTFEQTGAGDAEPPRLHSLSFSPRVVDTSRGPATITVTARITDDYSGHAVGGPTWGSQARFAAPGNSIQVINFFLDTPTRISGNHLDGIYEAKVTIPASAAQGTWTLRHVHLSDHVGNNVWVDTPELAAAGYPTTFEQIGAGDSRPPEIRSLSLAPRTIDTSAGDATITVTARITDDGAGHAVSSEDRWDSRAVFRSATGQTVFAYFMYFSFVSGDTHDATYRYTMTVPRHSEQGTWTLDGISLADRIGNQAYRPGSAFAGLPGFDTTFEVVRTSPPG